jgi:hypothetical protein
MGEKWEEDDWEDEDFFDRGYGLVNELSYDYLVLLSSVVPPSPPPDLDCDTTDTLFAQMIQEEIAAREHRETQGRGVRQIKLGPLDVKEVMRAMAAKQKRSAAEE